MNKQLLLSVLLLLVLNGIAQDLALYKARKYGANAKECLSVIDQDGRTVVGAKVWGGMQHGDGYNDFTPISGMTDTNGEYVIQGKCTNRIRCDITKNGYYRSELLLENYGYRHDLEKGKWMPYGERHTVVLKKIKNPCKLLAFPASLRWCRIPEFNKWLGFDFECCEWIAPHGKGRCADVLLRFSAMKKGLHDYKYVMDVSFTNNPYAGAYQMKADKSSDLTTTYDADSNATYKAEFSYVLEQSPGNRRYWNFLDTDSYLVFRTRTRVDKDNNLIGAHYGKILGCWRPGIEAMILSDGCFNPVENDVNIEDGTVLRTVLKNMGRGK